MAVPARPRESRMPAVHVDRAALQANWRTLDAAQPGTRTGAAVKADGYGLGAGPAAEALAEAGCRDFFVAWAEEGALLRSRLREAGFPHDTGAGSTRIFVLQGMEPAAVPLCLEHGLVPILSTLDDVAIWQDGLARAERAASAALQLETGMNRLGLDANDAQPAAAMVAGGELRVDLVMSHLASADEDTGQSEAQRRQFETLTRLFPGIERSLANSAGTMLAPAYGYDLTRPGIALYGGGAGPQTAGRLAPVATLTAGVLQVRSVPAGEAAGYGAAARLDRETRVATVGLGYADGYLRAASGAGVPLRDLRPAPQAFVGGRRVPVLGRVSMDLTLLDVTDCPEGAVMPGDRAEFFGPNIAIDSVAEAAGTIPYELLTGLGPRVRRMWR